MGELASIQRRFYELVVSGEGDASTSFLGSSSHPDVYSEMYYSRLRDVLAQDFSKLRTVLDDGFRELATAYIRARPPTSFTLRDFGAGLPGFLAAREDVPSWCADLAALERAFIEVNDGADSEALTRSDLSAVSIDRFPDFELQLVRASRLVPLRWTVDDLWSSLEDSAPHTTPQLCQRLVFVWRRDQRVLHRTLDSDEAELVGLLIQPTSIAAIAGKLDELGCDTPEQRMVELLARWVDSESLVR